jgi:hypothetical protein
MDDQESIQQLPSFHLRFDFPAELGFLDHVRQPLSLEAAADYCRTVVRKAFSFGAAKAINAERQRYQPPRFFLYLIAVPPKARQWQAWIHDGTSWLQVDDQGLFNDMLIRATVAQGKPPGTLTPIFPLIPAEPQDQWKLAPMAVLHDTQRSLAAVVPFEQARTHLKFNRQTT